MTQWHTKLHMHAISTRTRSNAQIPLSNQVLLLLLLLPHCLQQALQWALPAICKRLLQALQACQLLLQGLQLCHSSHDSMVL